MQVDGGDLRSLWLLPFAAAADKDIALTLKRLKCREDRGCEVRRSAPELERWIA